MNTHTHTRVTYTVHMDGRTQRKKTTEIVLNMQSRALKMNKQKYQKYLCVLSSAEALLVWFLRKTQFTQRTKR